MKPFAYLASGEGGGDFAPVLAQLIPLIGSRGNHHLRLPELVDDLLRGLFRLRHFFPLSWARIQTFLLDQFSGVRSGAMGVSRDRVLYSLSQHSVGAVSYFDFFFGRVATPQEFMERPNVPLHS